MDAESKQSNLSPAGGDSPQIITLSPVSALRIIRAVLADTNLSHAGRIATAAVICQANGGTGKAWASYRQLGREYGLAPASIARALRSKNGNQKLENGRAIGVYVEPSHRGASGAVCYRILPRQNNEEGAPQASSDSQHEAPQASNSSQHESPQASSDSQHEAPQASNSSQHESPQTSSDSQHKAPQASNSSQHESPQTSSDSRSETILTPDTTNNKNKQTVVDEAFSQFWKLYPKRRGKGAAEKAFKKVMAAADPPAIEMLLAAVEAQAQSPDWRHQAGKYIPYPSTWLNQQRWTDETAVAFSGDKKNEWDNAL